ncbi:hypothetical protein J6590_033627, partial [Homalodisca vitripennis]
VNSGVCFSAQVHKHSQHINTKTQAPREGVFWRIKREEFTYILHSSHIPARRQLVKSAFRIALDCDLKGLLDH